MKNNLLPVERIESKIYLIRAKKVMFDRDLAQLYGVETKVLNQAVKRNLERFPEDFMSQLTKEEIENWKSQFVTSNKEKMGLRKAPFAFTEIGHKFQRHDYQFRKVFEAIKKILEPLPRPRRRIGFHA